MISNANFWYLQRLYQKPRTLACVFVLLVGLIYLTSLYFVIQGTTNSFSQRVHFWESEISGAVLDKDWMRSGRALQAIMGPDLIGVELREDNGKIFSHPSDFSSGACTLKLRYQIKYYGRQIATVASCGRLGLLSLQTLGAPTFIVLIFILTMILVFSAIAPLAEYRTSILNTFSVLRKRLEGSYTPQETYHPIRSDRITDEIMSLVDDLLKEKSERRSAEVMGKLATKLAHDIASPLSAMRIALKHDLDRSDVRNLLKQSIERTQEISEDLLCRVRENNFQVSEEQALGVEEFDLKEAIDPILNEKKFLYPKIEFLMNLTPSAKPIIANRADVKSTLSNLINNAVEALPSNDGTIEISTFCKEDKIVLSIKDNGKGIPKAVLKKLGNFRFSRSSKEKGNGVGLYFAKEMLSRYGGQLSVNSTLGAGTEVNLEFSYLGVPRPVLPEFKI